MTDLPERLVEAMARERRSMSKWSWGRTPIEIREKWCAEERIVLAAALAEAEKGGVVLVKVPPPPEPRYQHHTVWCEGYVAATAAVIKGKVTP
jgi:hypothetical protein